MFYNLRECNDWLSIVIHCENHGNHTWTFFSDHPGTAQSNRIKISEDWSRFVRFSTASLNKPIAVKKISKDLSILPKMNVWKMHYYKINCCECVPIAQFFSNKHNKMRTAHLLLAVHGQLSLINDKELWAYPDYKWLENEHIDSRQ